MSLHGGAVDWHPVAESQIDERLPGSRDIAVQQHAVAAAGTQAKQAGLIGFRAPALQDRLRLPLKATAKPSPVASGQPSCGYRSPAA